MNDRQLACARIDSKEGQEYLNGMAAAANFAWVNRSSMTFLARQVVAFKVIICNLPSVRSFVCGHVWLAYSAIYNNLNLLGFCQDVQLNT